LFPHVKEVLEELRQMKLHLAVATSSVSASARPFLDRHQLTGFFEVIVTGEEVERGKPAPDIYLCAAEQLGIPADACLVVEDALSGVAAAKAASMRVAAIPDRRFVDPREYEKIILRANQDGSAIVRLGDVAFSAPSLLGSTARQAGIVDKEQPIQLSKS